MEESQKATSFEPIITPDSYTKSQKEQEKRRKEFVVKVMILVFSLIEESRKQRNIVKLDKCTSDILEYLQISM